MESNYLDSIRELARMIRDKEKESSSFFLACYELFPRNVWAESIEMDLLTNSELQACMLALKAYRHSQAVAAIIDN